MNEYLIVAYVVVLLALVILYGLCQGTVAVARKVGR